MDARHLLIIDPRLDYSMSVPDNFPYGNAETMTNARPGDEVSFYLSGNLSRLGSARVLSTRRTSWDADDMPAIEQAQQLLDKQFNRTCGLDAGLHCKEYGTCLPRVWHVAFASDIPEWGATNGARGIVATLNSWTASGAVVKDSHLHHGRFGIRWKSSNATITGNRISARYVEISPLEYYMEGPFRLGNIVVANNTFSVCNETASLFPSTDCEKNLPLGFWRKWTAWGGGTGGVCKAAAVGATELVAGTCTDIFIQHNKQH